MRQKISLPNVSTDFRLMSIFIISTTRSDEEEKRVSQVLQLTTAQKRDEISVIM